MVTVESKIINIHGARDGARRRRARNPGPGDRHRGDAAGGLAAHARLLLDDGAPALRQAVADSADRGARARRASSYRDMIEAFIDADPERFPADRARSAISSRARRARSSTADRNTSIRRSGSASTGRPTSTSSSSSPPRASSTPSTTRPAASADPDHDCDVRPCSRTWSTRRSGSTLL